jgi:hypothetical protein
VQVFGNADAFKVLDFLTAKLKLLVGNQWGSPLNGQAGNVLSYLNVVWRLMETVNTSNPALELVRGRIRHLNGVVLELEVVCAGHLVNAA